MNLYKLVESLCLPIGLAFLSGLIPLRPRLRRIESNSITWCRAAPVLAGSRTYDEGCFALGHLLSEIFDAYHDALSSLPEFAQSRLDLDHQFLKKAPDVERQFEDDSSYVSKGSPSADQPSKPSIKMATAAPPCWSRMLAAVVARNPSWQ